MTISIGARAVSPTRWYAPWGLRTPVPLRRGRPNSPRRWAAEEMRRHDWRQVFEAGYAACQFDSRQWIGEIDLPTAVVVTTRDRAIPIDAQLQLADSIRDTTVYAVDDDHNASSHAHFAPVLVAACRDVAERATRGPSPTERRPRLPR